MSLTVIVITRPEFFPGEAQAVAALLQSGVIDRVHLRKPGAKEDRMRDLIESIPQELHPRLSLHDCHALAEEYGCGIHLNSRCRTVPEGFAGIVSRSCHTPEETGLYPEDDYHFLSPVYPSISKPGYLPPFRPESLCGIADRRTVALGGVTPEKFGELAGIGFGGAAMLGCVWEAVDKGNIHDLIRKIQCCNL